MLHPDILVLVLLILEVNAGACGKKFNAASIRQPILNITIAVSFLFGSEDRCDGTMVPLIHRDVFQAPYWIHETEDGMQL